MKAWSSCHEHCTLMQSYDRCANIVKRHGITFTALNCCTQYTGMCGMFEHYKKKQQQQHQLMMVAQLPAFVSKHGPFIWLNRSKICHFSSRLLYFNIYSYDERVLEKTFLLQCIQMQEFQWPNNSSEFSWSVFFLFFFGKHFTNSSTLTENKRFFPFLFNGFFVFSFRYRKFDNFPETCELF